MKRKRRSNLALARRTAGFGVDARVARKIGGGEEKIADLILDGVRFAGIKRRFDLAGFLADFIENADECRSSQNQRWTPCSAI